MMTRMRDRAMVCKELFANMSQAIQPAASARVPGHFGEWMQGRLGQGGPLVLITLACPDLAVTARRVADGPLALEQERAVLAPDQAARLLGALGLPVQGRYRLHADMPPGGGAGASTAALVALARAAGYRGTVKDLAVACLAAEGASDPLMLTRPDGALWAPREAREVQAISPPPPCDIIGGFLGPPQRTDPVDLAFPDIGDLVAAWRDARGDRAALAALASASAQRCTAMRGPSGDPMAALARDLGALGHARAHTGSARALIFAPGCVPLDAGAALRAAGLSGVLRFSTGGA